MFRGVLNEVGGGSWEPGSQYKGTRHNVGFDVVAELVRRLIPESLSQSFSRNLRGVCWREKVLLLMPQTYMNRSGDAVQQCVKFYQVGVEDVVVVCDDMNLPVGKLRWRGSGSSGGQKGLADILQKLGSENVPRLRMVLGVRRVKWIRQTGFFRSFAAKKNRMWN